MNIRPTPVTFYLGKDIQETLFPFLKAMLVKLGRRIFATDNLITFDRNAGFVLDDRFRSIFDRHAEDEIDLSIIWRTHILAWAATSCLPLEGDFVECGTYRGFSARVLYDYVGLAKTDKGLYLYDLFEPRGRDGEGLAMPSHGPQLADRVRARFQEAPNVRIIAGKVPASLATESPERIAFLHIDMNDAEAERGALEALWDRITTGGMVVFDDYGWLAYRDQKDTIDQFLANRHHQAAELPTGQGLVIKRG